MKRVVICMCALGLALMAPAYEWTGSVDASWNNPANWNPAGVPKTAEDVVELKGANPLTLDTSSTNVISYLRAFGGSTTTLDATSGSVLELATPTGDANVSGLVIDSGAKLVLESPVRAALGAKELRRWGTGEFELRAPLAVDAGNIFFCGGTNVFARGAVVDLAVGKNFYTGLYIQTGRALLRLQDDASIHAHRFSFAGGGSVCDFEVEQDGDDTRVMLDEALHLCAATRPNDGHLYWLKRGTLSAAGGLSVEKSTGGNPTNAHYRQTGGTATFSSLSMISASAALEDGTLNLTGNTVSFGTDTRFYFTGGTLNLSDDITLAAEFRLAGSPVVSVPSGKTATWGLGRESAAPGTVLVKDGAGALSFNRSTAVASGLDLRAGTTTIGSGVTLRGTDDLTPWPLTIRDGATLAFTDISSRLSLPVDLAIVGTGKITMPKSGHYTRGAILARKLTVDGVPQAKGRYCAKNVGWLDGLDPASVIVPYVWTGAGDGRRWNDPANWEGNAVPPSDQGTTTAVDLSAATTVQLDDAVCLFAVVAMPAQDRTVTITGSGSIAETADVGYACGFYVAEGCNLALDVDVTRTTSMTKTILGGGQVTVTKTFPANLATHYTPYYAMDARLVFAGTMALGSNHLSFWSHEDKGAADFEIVDGANVTAGAFRATDNGFYAPKSQGQSGGTATFSSFYLTAYRNIDDLTYRLSGGTMTVSGSIDIGQVYLNRTWDRYAGGRFEMSGGILTCDGFRTDDNSNCIELYGGKLQVTATRVFEYAHSDGSRAEYVQDEHYLRLGGVTITGTNPSKYPIWNAPSCELTGRGGDTTIDICAYTFKVDTTVTMCGHGGLVLTNSSDTARNVTFRPRCAFTGDITVGGKLTVYMDGTAAAGPALAGPRVLRVTDANAVLNLSGDCAVEKSPEEVFLAASSCLILGSDKQSMTVKRLVVGGTEYEPGEYTFMKGKVTVAPRPASWLVDGKADLSFLADGAVQALTENTTVSSLVYRPVASGGVTLAATGSETLTLADGAIIDVGEGSVLTLDARTVCAGTVTKIGKGKVVFADAVTCAGEPSAEGTAGFTVREGAADVAGAVTGVRLVTASYPDGAAPVLTLKAGCTVSDYAVILTAYDPSATGRVFGETRIEGASVACAQSPAAFSARLPLTSPKGGTGRLVLSSGTLDLSSQAGSVFEMSSDIGSFEIEVNGGVFRMPKDLLLKRADGQAVSLALNGGRLEFSDQPRSAAGGRTRTKVALNGGTISVSKSVSGFLADGLYDVTLGGAVAFEQTAADVSVSLRADISGAGSVLQQGLGTLSFGGFVTGVTNLTVAGGAVALGEKAQMSLPASCTVDLDQGTTLRLGFDGLVTVDRMTVDGRPCPVRTYSAGDGSRAGRYLSGPGQIAVMAYDGGGLLLIVR